MKIELSDYWMGRDSRYRAELFEEIQRNALECVRRCNALLDRYGMELEPSPSTGSLVTSGWRPSAVNAGTIGAAPKSKHMTGKACDLYDPEGALDDWCMDHLEVLEEIGLWMEHPSATKGWCHLQSVPPHSGKRVFYP